MIAVQMLEQEDDPVASFKPMRNISFMVRAAILISTKILRALCNQQLMTHGPLWI